MSTGAWLLIVAGALGLVYSLAFYLRFFGIAYWLCFRQDGVGKVLDRTELLKDPPPTFWHRVNNLARGHIETWIEERMGRYNDAPVLLVIAPVVVPLVIWLGWPFWVRFHARAAARLLDDLLTTRMLAKGNAPRETTEGGAS